MYSFWLKVNFDRYDLLYNCEVMGLNKIYVVVGVVLFNGFIAMV
jgi:hypothetical protein